MNGSVYRMVVNVRSDFGDPNVRFAEIEHPLAGGPWSKGWHPDQSVDYPSTLGLHSDAGFTPLPMDALVTRVVDAIPLNARVSTYAVSSGGNYAHSAHKIHRNGSYRDGALVIDADTGHPRWLVFHFANQRF